MENTWKTKTHNETFLTCWKRKIYKQCSLTVMSYGYGYEPSKLTNKCMENNSRNTQRSMLKVNIGKKKTLTGGKKSTWQKCKLKLKISQKQYRGEKIEVGETWGSNNGEQIKQQAYTLDLTECWADYSETRHEVERWDWKVCWQNLAETGTVPWLRRGWGRLL